VSSPKSKALCSTLSLAVLAWDASVTADSKKQTLTDSATNFCSLPQNQPESSIRNCLRPQKKKLLDAGPLEK
jgi:hypothetical protein